MSGIKQVESRVSGSGLFFLVCLFWFSQSFLIPLAPLGPSWAVWPTLTDLVVIVMIPLILSQKSRRTLDDPSQTVLRLTRNAFYLCSISFLVASVVYGMRDDLRVIGAYQCVRLLQYLVVIYATVQLDMSLSRWNIFRWLSLSVFLLISIGVLLNFLGVVSGSAVTPLLPASPLFAGPWGAYVAGSVHDGGFISYNHAYAGAQLILSGGVAFLFFEQSKYARLLISLLFLVSIFCTGSRASLIVAILLVAAWEWKRTNSNLIVIALFCCLALSWFAGAAEFGDAVERQSSSASSLEDDGLSGRTGIWQEHLDYFASNPLNMLFGTGYGYNGKVSASNAHLLYLHVLTESGLAGLLFFLYLQKKTLFLLQSPHLRVMRLTVWALLLTGLTQETLYPTSAFTHFVGFYLSALVMALRFPGCTVFPVIAFTHQPNLGSTCRRATA